MSVHDKRGRVPQQTRGEIGKASPRPWRVEHITRNREAIIRASDDTLVAICHADNAEMIVAAVNDEDVSARIAVEIERKAVAV